ncbi:hypothetical protein ACWTV9_10310 [Clostridioides difficile]|nr:hypothetical protein KW95_13950 [Clostridioides difficile]
MKDIKFEDYILLGCNALPEELQVDFLDYLKYISYNNFVNLESQINEMFNFKKLPNRNPEQIIEGILATSPKELDKKRMDKNYYSCNALCLIETIKMIYNPQLCNALSNENVPKHVLDNYKHILKYMLLDLGELNNLYNNNIKNNFKYSSNIDSRYIHYSSVHQVLRQSLFGQFSFNSFCDMEISSSIAVIRQLIELRIRRAFGVISYIEKDSGKLLPLELSLIFERVKIYKDKITLPISIENIERIYRWSNMYVHSGKCELSWIPYYLENILRSLSFGEKTQTGWDVKNSIVVPENIICKIHKDLLKDKPRLDIYSCRLECVHKL